MKKILFAISLLLVCNAISFAQCDKKIIITSSTTEYLDADSVLERTVEENTIIEINKPDITIRPGDKTMNAVIISDSCNWKIPFKEGRTTFKVTFSDDQGNKMNATLTIEGKDGKLTLLVISEGSPTIIRVPIEKFEEKS